MPSDPNIVLNAVGFSFDGELMQKAGCCITLEFEDEYGKKSTRTITHPIGSASIELANLQAAHLALAAVVRSMRRIATVMLVCSEGVRAILDKTDPAYSEAQADNTDVVGETRKWVTFYDRLKFAPCTIENIAGFDKAKKCAESQSGFDTGTVV